MAVEAFAAQGPAVLHLCGARDYASLRDRVDREGYVLRPFTDDFGAALGGADLVVSRAGGSVWEIAAAGRPVILVPYPHATGDHQLENARYFEQNQGALIVLDEQARTAVPDLVKVLLSDPTRLERMGAAMASLAHPEAADRIAEELIRLAV
jgi:UDP-N-acetylglucosamine--N-acetylmuramyl-(pentapeptide) pyrophosphoryl-undecaprenol N-acetylglucosamine transferase